MGTTADKLEHLAKTKIAIKNAIIESGIEILEETPFQEYADKASQIIGQFDIRLNEIIGKDAVSNATLTGEELKKTTATPETVLIGYTFYSQDNELKTGTYDPNWVIYELY